MEVTTAAGAVPVRQPRVTDEWVDETTGEPQRSASTIPPAWARASPRRRSRCCCFPCTGSPPTIPGRRRKQFLDSSAGPSAAVITRMIKDWQDLAEAFANRSLADTDRGYLWVDDIHLKVRL